MRGSRLGLIGMGGLVCVAVALASHRVRSTPHSAPALGPSSDSIDEARARLAQFEAEQRGRTDFLHLSPAGRTHGADPYTLARLDAQHLVGVLRGAGALVVLDNDLHELSRVELERGATSVDVSESGECWVAGESTGTLLRFRWNGHTLGVPSEFSVPHMSGIRALASGNGRVLYALDARDGQLLTLEPGVHGMTVLDVRAAGHGPLSLKRVGRSLIVDPLLEHTLTVYDIDQRGRISKELARIHHDGPIWGFDAARLTGGTLLLTLTGVEDHPLVRSEEGFGYIDSFVFCYALSPRGKLERLWQTNVSEWGVVTPKSPVLRVEGGAATLFVSGYGSDHAVELRFDAASPAAPRVHSEAFYPGVSAGIALDSGALAFADPLLDAWLLRPAAGAGPLPVQVSRVDSPRAPRASAEERLGEALFFTTLMAPTNSSEGSHSRFTCETCHFEGYVDGRVHYTGRADVSVVTKPLRGLFNNRPHFSRALDPDLATVSHHEFRVAGKGSGTDPWFALDHREFPWLSELGAPPGELGPESLRRALMAFLMRFSFETNPRVLGRSRFDADERHGAALFQEHCERCHAARLESDRAPSALPFEAWEGAIFSAEGPIVWASAAYEKTGVVPYVHELGTRVPSLRRLYLKWPHFTNGSANTILDVLARARFDGERFYHDHPPHEAGLGALSPDEARELAAFLELL